MLLDLDLFLKLTRYNHVFMDFGYVEFSHLGHRVFLLLRGLLSLIIRLVFAHPFLNAVFRVFVGERRAISDIVSFISSWALILVAWCSYV
jgi:hypothetical protein